MKTHSIKIQIVDKATLVNVSAKTRVEAVEIMRKLLENSGSKIKVLD